MTELCVVPPSSSESFFSNWLAASLEQFLLDPLENFNTIFYNWLSTEVPTDFTIIKNFFVTGKCKHNLALKF